MGYTRVFKGSFTLNKPLTTEQYEILKDAGCIWSYSNDDIEGSCQWRIQNDKQTINGPSNDIPWDCSGWIRYIIDVFIRPWGYILNGKVKLVNVYEYNEVIIVITNNIVEVIKCEDCHELTKRFKELEAKLLAYEQRLADFEIHLKYMPGGEGAQEAQAHFMSQVNH